jgi:hypothetical protein
METRWANKKEKERIFGFEFESGDNYRGAFKTE